jgi:hypothetical protein
MTDYSQVNWGDAVNVALADLNETKEKLTKKKFEKKEVDLTKYFSLNLGQNEKTGTKIFRILPDQENPLKFAKEVYFHYIQVGKEWKKLYDPSQNRTIKDAISPLNDARDALNAHPDKEVKKQAMKYRPKLFYIIRGIERGKEHEGIKFWRFPAVSDGSGIMDKIESLIGIYNQAAPGAGAFWNPIAGRDLIISLGKDEQRGFTKVANMIVSDPKPLHSDGAQSTAWLTDPIKWEDVYKKFSTDYLTVVADGGVPTWSKEANNGQGGYVAKTEDDAQAPAATASAPVQTVTMSAAPAATVAQPAPVATAPIVASPLESNEAAVQIGLDDLPF